MENLRKQLKTMKVCTIIFGCIGFILGLIFFIYVRSDRDLGPAVGMAIAIFAMGAFIGFSLPSFFVIIMTISRKIFSFASKFVPNSNSENYPLGIVIYIFAFAFVLTIAVYGSPIVSIYRCVTINKKIKHGGVDEISEDKTGGEV